MRGSTRCHSTRTLLGADAADLPLGARTATELGELLDQRAVSSEEIVRACLARIERLDSTLSAFITVCAERALARARRADAERASGVLRGPLHGVPFAVKDQIWAKDLRATNGSRLFADFVPSRDATVVARLEESGAILLGKLNMMEIGFGPTLAPPYGVPRNPWDLSRTPGGSSSGSASAVAAGFCPLTLGADTGGSIRLPAAFCGVVGLKPTRGRVSLFGLMGMCPELDCIGPLARTAADCALVLAAIAGHDRLDPRSRETAVGAYSAGLGAALDGLRVGVVRETMASPFLREDVQRAVGQAVGAFTSLGATVGERSIPLIEIASALYIAIAEPEAVMRYRGHLVDGGGSLDPFPRRRLLAASLIPAFASARAWRLRDAFRRQVDRVLSEVDVLVTPTAPTPASSLSVSPRLRSKGEARAAAARSTFTNPFSVTGHPAISLPCGFTAEGLPIGLQLIGRPDDEATLLRVAHQYQLATEWHRRRPTVQPPSDGTIVRHS